jgi:hypothetical protein
MLPESGSSQEKMEHQPDLITTNSRERHRALARRWQARGAMGWDSL